jgi:hypothetical protein
MVQFVRLVDGNNHTFDSNVKGAQDLEEVLAQEMAWVHQVGLKQLKPTINGDMNFCITIRCVPIFCTTARAMFSEAIALFVI